VSRALQFATIIGIAIILWVIFLCRKRKLREGHALLWLSTSATIILLSTWSNLISAINYIVGAEKASDVVLSAFIVLLLLVDVYYSVKISELAKQNKKLAQEIAILTVRKKEEKDNL